MRMPSVLGTALTLALVAIACGGDDGADPVTLCNVQAERQCVLAFECFTEAERQQLGTPGSDSTQCSQTVKAQRSCPAATEVGTCSMAKTYNASTAQACVDEYNSATCESIMVATETSCDDVCQ